MARHLFTIGLLILALAAIWLFMAVWPEWLSDLIGGKRLFVNTILNGVTLAGLYFLVASGFTLVFGLMRNVNLAHGSLYLLGGYIGFEVADDTGSWYLGVAAGFLAMAAAGVVMQAGVFRRMENDPLRQTLVTIGISIVLADLMLWVWGGRTYQFDPPEWLMTSTSTPIVTSVKDDGTEILLAYPTVRLMLLVLAVAIGVGLWLFLNRTRIGMMIRAGVDDRRMLAATGINEQLVFVVVFALGAGLAGFAGVIGGSAFSISPGEDTRTLLASLVVVIVGGMGSIAGAAIGALLIGLAEQIGLAYLPTYGVVFTFLIMIVVLAVRPQGIMGRAA
ncbi:MAG: branched-chain amino acid ABC transporter permease [Alphaproteobacteria bacterium]